MKNFSSLKLLFAIISLTMAWLVVNTAMKSNLFTVRIDEPWFTTTLIDFYFNIAILTAWVVYRETSAVSRTAWILGFILTGSIATSLYVFIQLCLLKPGDPFENILIRKQKKGI